MPLQNYQYDTIMREYNRRQAQNRRLQEAHQAEAYEKIPRLREIDEEVATLSARKVRALINRQESGIDDLRNDIALLSQERTALLLSSGYPADYLEMPCTCPICQDKGIVNDKWCQCFQKLLMEETARELNRNSPLSLSSFESFRLDLYPDVINPALRVSERAIMQRNLEFCKTYAENFTEQSEGILMSGATGLGKTHLSLAIASKVLQKGYTVIYGSSPELLHTLEREYFGKSDKDTMSALTGCDLLIFDDLGAEMDKPLYESLLYEIINARVCRRLPMIVSTNYNTTDLQKHYPDKICSRLLSFRLMAFFGNDIRRVLKKEAKF